MGSFGALVHGPLGHLFYGYLEKKLPGPAPSVVASKVSMPYTTPLSVSYDLLTQYLMTVYVGIN